MLVLNKANTHYTKKNVPNKIVQVPANATRQKVGQPYDGRDEKLGRDDNTYSAVFFPKQNADGIPEGWYLADNEGRLTYKIDVPIKRDAKVMDNGDEAPERFKAPQPQLFALIIEGILGGDLEWTFVILGALIAITMELLGISALPVAVGMYLGLSTATPIFCGGMLRWLADRSRGVSASEAETETSPGVLLSSGYIAGGTLCGLLFGFLVMLMPKATLSHLYLGQFFAPESLETVQATVAAWLETGTAKVAALCAFFVLGAILLRVGMMKGTPGEEQTNRSQNSESV
jgi:hypothetical protein